MREVLFDRDAATLANPCSVFARIATADSATAVILAGSTHGGSSDAQPIVAISKQSMAEKRTGYVNVLIDDADMDPVVSEKSIVLSWAVLTRSVQSDRY